MAKMSVAFFALKLGLACACIIPLYLRIQCFANESMWDEVSTAIRYGGKMLCYRIFFYN